MFCSLVLKIAVELCPEVRHKLVEFGSEELWCLNIAREGLHRASGFRFRFLLLNVANFQHFYGLMCLTKATYIIHYLLLSGYNSTYFFTDTRPRSLLAQLT